MEENKIDIVDQTTEPTTPVEETKEEVVQTEEATPEVDESAEQGEEIDYKLELERTQEKLRKAEYTLYKKNKGKSAETDESVEDIGAIVDHRVENKLNQFVSDFVGDFVEETIYSLTSNPDEQALIKAHYENTIRKTGYSKKEIREDLEKAYLIANAPKIKKRASELQLALKSKNTVGRSGLGSNQDKPKPNTDPIDAFSPQEQKFIKSRNWTPEMIKKAAEEKLKQR